jgi:hypothetical protein
VTSEPLVIPMADRGAERILWGIVAALMPAAIAEIERRGGPTEADYEFSREVGFVLAGTGDVLMFGGQRKEGDKTGKARAGSGQIARALAPLAWREGGVVVAGMLFRAGVADG